MILPSIILIGIFRFSPLIFGVTTSFCKWNLLNPRQFVGFNNYLTMFEDDDFWQSLFISLYYALLTIPTTIIISLVLAVVIDGIFTLKNFFRTAFFLPFTLCLAVVSLIWKALYNPSIGLFSIAVRTLGFKSFPILSSDKMVIPGLAIVGIWRFIGFYLIIFLAALQAIPNELHEAARIDGASNFQIFLKITIPLLKPTIFLSMVLSTTQSLQIFSQIFVMTKGGPANASRTIVYYIWQKGFSELQMGYAQAMVVFSLIMLLVVTQLYKKLFQPSEE